MGLAQFSLTNLTNSVAERLAATLLAAGYLIHWGPLDALQTPDGLYPTFQENAEDILADSTVQAHYAASRGILMLRDDDFSFPQYLGRPTSDGSLPALDDVPVPTIALSISHSVNGMLVGLGSRERDRHEDVLMLGMARDRAEQVFLLDLLRVAFDESQFLPVLDHDAGTRAIVGYGELQAVEVTSAIYPKKPDSMVFEFTLTARLRYEA